MAPEYQNHILMEGYSEPVSCLYSGACSKMPKPPNQLLQANPLKYLKTFLVLLRPARLREYESDFTPIDSNLISTEDRKNAIAWLSPKLIKIMNENAELERQVKNQGPRRTKVLGAEVYQPITLYKMREEEWHGSDFGFCLTEAMKRLPKEEIKNTRFMQRLGRNPLNGAAARCAADTTRELGLSLREWINARCVNGNGSRMNLLCTQIEGPDMRNHALALNAAPPPTRAASSSTRVPTPQPQSQLQSVPKAQPQPKSKPQPKPKAKGRKRRSRNSALNSDEDDDDGDDDAGDSGDHASDSDYAQPPRKKTAKPTASTPKSKTKASSVNAAQQQKQKQKQKQQRASPASPGAAVARSRAPATPVGRQIEVKEEQWSSV